MEEQTTLPSSQKRTMPSEKVETRTPSNPITLLNPATISPRKIGRRFSYVESSGFPAVADDMGVSMLRSPHPHPLSTARPGMVKPHAGVTSAVALIHTELEIDDPVQCGHLLAFCDSEFSSEDLRFIMEVDRLRNYILADTTSWNKDWRRIDKDMKLSTSLRDRISTLILVDDVSACESAKTPCSVKLVHEIERCDTATSSTKSLLHQAVSRLDRLDSLQFDHTKRVSLNCIIAPASSFIKDLLDPPKFISHPL